MADASTRSRLRVLAGAVLAAGMVVVVWLAIVEMRSGVHVSGGPVRILTLEPRGDANAVQVRATLVLDPATGCVTDGRGHPIAFPDGTTVEGEGAEWTVVSVDGDRFGEGSQVVGQGVIANQRGLSADWGDLPDDCGPPPWVAIDDALSTPVD